MTPTEIITRLYDLGHFHNPANPTGVKQSDLPNLKLHDTAVRTAIQSFTEFMTGNITDPADPKTIALITEPRCGFPDYPYPEGVLPAQAEANWPGGCRGKLKFSRSFKSLPGMSEEDTSRAFIGMSNNWTYALNDVDVNANAIGDSSAHIYAGLKALGGGTLAWSFLANNSCSDKLEQAYDNTRSWNLALAITVSSHEVGHALGLPHNRDGDALMYPSIHSRSLARLGYPNTTDLAQAKGLGYSLSGSQPPKPSDLYRPRPHTPVPNPDPDEPTPPGKFWFSGGFTLMDGDKEVGQFILTPKPEV